MDYNYNETGYNTNFSDTVNYTTMMRYHESRPETYFVPAVLAIVFIVGVLGNGALVFIFLREKQVRNAPNLIIFSLALSDLLVVLFSAPLKATSYYAYSYPFSEMICKFAESLEEFSLGVSSFALIALTACSSITLKNVRRSQTRILTIVAIAVIWILAVVFAVPTMIHTYLGISRSDAGELQQFVCTNVHLYEFELIRLHVHYAIPLIVVSCIYVVVVALRLANGRSTTQNRTQAQSEFSQFVFTLFAIFAIFYFPRYVTIMWYNFHGYSVTWYTVSTCFYCLTFAYHCVSPIVLYCVSGTFRNFFNRHLLCWCFGSYQVALQENESSSQQRVERTLI